MSKRSDRGDGGIDAHGPDMWAMDDSLEDLDP
jgi:hypothetical protein